MASKSSSHWKVGIAFVLACVIIGTLIAIVNMTRYSDQGPVSHEDTASAYAATSSRSSDDIDLYPHDENADAEPASSFRPTLTGDRQFDSALWAWKMIEAENGSRTAEEFDEYGSPCDEGMDCWDDTTVEVMFKGGRLLSSLVRQDQYLGGAHGVVYVGDYQFDLLTKERLRFGDLFQSWPSVRPVLQRVFCQNLQRNREPDGLEIECPNIEETALVLARGEGNSTGKATRIVVYTSDYQLGSYVAGRASVPIIIDKVIYDQLKSQYQSEITF